jgi:hypothetical protein
VQFALATLLIEKAGQGVHAVLPVAAAKVPAEQLIHCDLVVTSGIVPAAHIVHVDALAADTDPAKHATHAVLLAPIAYDPLVQARQEELKDILLYVPIPHDVQTEVPVSEA